MRYIFRFAIVIIIYAVLLLVLDFIMGIAIQDQWDKLMKWARK